MTETGSQLPAAAWSGDVEQFGRYVAGCGQDYLLVDRAGRQRARVRFLGHFQGRPVVWDCEFVTLAAEYGDRAGQGGDAAPRRRNFIEVGQPAARGRSLRVGLSLPCIDPPAIEKMIIMIRNYKRLAPGRHEYGAA